MSQVLASHADTGETQQRLLAARDGGLERATAWRAPEAGPLSAGPTRLVGGEGLPGRAFAGEVPLAGAGEVAFPVVLPAEMATP